MCIRDSVSVDPSRSLRSRWQAARGRSGRTPGSAARIVLDVLDESRTGRTPRDARGATVAADGVVNFPGKDEVPVPRGRNLRETALLRDAAEWSDRVRSALC